MRAKGHAMSDLVRLLTPEGERIHHQGGQEYDRWVADVDAEPVEWFRRLYRDLVLVRRFDAEAVALQRQGELGLWASSLGQEAAQVGAGRALRASDHAFPTYREHGVAWCRGVDLVGLLGLFRGTTMGGWDPNDHGLHLPTIVVGAQTLHATGYAMGIQRDGLVGSGDAERDAAVVAFLGDGAMSQGDVNEAFVWAGVMQAPVVFFCQNNQWAISEPTERQTRIPPYRRAQGFGFPGVQVDGNDVLACLAVTRAALARAREGSGPTLIEAYTYRMGAHTTSDDPSRYRVAAELEQWRLKDPVERVKAMLLRGQTPAQAADSSAFVVAVDAEADALAADVRARCLALPDPEPLGLFEHVHAAMAPGLRAQQEALAAELRAEEVSP